MWQHGKNAAKKSDERILGELAHMADQGLTLRTLESIRQSPEYVYWERNMNALVKIVGELKS